jgi:hypothetical protein
MNEAGAMVNLLLTREHPVTGIKFYHTATCKCDRIETVFNNRTYFAYLEGKRLLKLGLWAYMMHGSCLICNRNFVFACCEI